MLHLTFNSRRNVSCQLSVVNCQNGFTLIEFLTVFAVLGLVSVLVASLYFAHFKLFSNQNTLVDLSSQNKLILDDVTNQVRESQAVVSACCGGDTTSGSVLVLRLWPLDGSGEPFQPTGNAYDFVVYRQDPQDSTKLIKKVVPDSASTRQAKTSILATTVTSLAFTYDNADPTQASEITIDVENTKTTYGKTHTISQSASAVLRNK